jgi:predicted transcriptional regulator
MQSTIRFKYILCIENLTMVNIMPQELEVWYLLPALRKEFAKIFVGEYNLKQKEVAHLIGLTEAAVSQYLQSKRGTELKFTTDEKNLISKYAKKIIADRENFNLHLFDVCRELCQLGTICSIHKRMDKAHAKNCNICHRQ